MIELNAPTLTAPDIFSLIPPLETAGPVESIDPSAPIEQDFSALLTELIGPVEIPVTPEIPQFTEIAVNRAQEPRETENFSDARKVEDSQKAEEIEFLTAFAPLAPDGSVSGLLAPISDFGIRNSDLGSSLTEAGSLNPKPETRNPKSAPGDRSHSWLPIEHWADVKKFEFKVVQQDAGRPPEAPPQPLIAPAPVEALKPAMVTSDPIANTQQQQLTPRVAIPAEARPQTQPAPAPVPVEAQKPAIVTSDPIANTQQQQLPLRVTAIQKVTIEAGLPERRPKSETAPRSNDHILAPAVQFSDVASASGGAPAVEQALPAHHVEIPDAPHVQVVRTVAMEVGDEASQVVIRIQERGGNVSLQLDAASEPMRHNLQSTVGSLVQALRREDVQVSSVEVSRKSPIEKVRRMKEAH